MKELLRRALLENSNEEAGDAAEKCYQAQFRGPNVRFFSELHESEQSTLVFSRKEAIARDLGISRPLVDDEATMERYYDFVAGIEIRICDDAEVVDLCNYKGEGAGIAFFEEVADLPVFVSKRQSFKAFGA